MLNHLPFDSGTSWFLLVKDFLLFDSTVFTRHIYSGDILGDAIIYVKTKKSTPKNIAKTNGCFDTINVFACVLFSYIN